MDSFWKWVIEPFKKPRYLMTWVDDFRITLTIIIGIAIIIGLIWLIATIVEKIGDAIR